MQGTMSAPRPLGEVLDELEREHPELLIGAEMAPPVSELAVALVAEARMLAHKPVWTVAEFRVWFPDTLAHIITEPVNWLELPTVDTVYPPTVNDGALLGIGPYLFRGHLTITAEVGRDQPLGVMVPLMVPEEQVNPTSPLPDNVVPFPTRGSGLPENRLSDHTADPSFLGGVMDRAKTRLHTRLAEWGNQLPTETEGGDGTNES